VFPAERPIDLVQGDAEILRFLEDNGFPAERCANSDPVTAPRGRGVFATDYLEGVMPERSEQTLYSLGATFGRLNTLPAGSGRVLREAGSLHHYSHIEGLPRNEIAAATSWLDGG